MAAKKIFVVFGATGNQGGSVIKSMLADAKASQEFKLRGITRDPSSGRAKALSEKGVECVAVRLSLFQLALQTNTYWLYDIRAISMTKAPSSRPSRAPTASSP